jgi:hypothetical protein
MSSGITKSLHSKKAMTLAALSKEILQRGETQ